MARCFCDSFYDGAIYFIADLDNENTHSKIRRHALSAKKALLDMEAEQFIP
jgi:hypothetical protein